MTINNYSKIKYSLGEEAELKKNSNIVKVNFINPIIFFVICRNEDIVIVNIKNNSGVTIVNTIYRVCPGLNSGYTEEVKINDSYYKCNDKNNNEIYIGCLKNNDSIIIKYKNEYLKGDSLLSYSIKVGDKLIRMHITDNIIKTC